MVEAKLIASNGTAGDWFGDAVAIHGDWLTVGVQREEFDSGAVYVFRRDGDTWIEHRRITDPSNELGGQLGAAVAIHDGTVFVGAPSVDGEPGEDIGAAYLLAVTGPDCDGDGTLDACESDCNVNGIADPCDVFPLGASDDCNFDLVPDECQLVGNDCNANAIPDDCEPDDDGNGVPDGCCVATSECIDPDPWTFDLCSANTCTNTPAEHGDLAGNGATCGPNGTVDLSDILAVLDGFQSVFAPGCEVSNVDIASQSDSCASDGLIDLSDILAVLDAFQGITTCCR